MRKFLIHTKIKVIFSLLLLVLVNSCNNQKAENEFYLPGEFEPLNSTCFVWTNQLYGIVPKLAGIISSKDTVTLFVKENSDKVTDIGKILQENGSNLQLVKFIKLKEIPDNAWIRDFGPAYLLNKKGGRKIVSFNYFGKHLTFNEEIAAKQNVPVIQSNLTSSGGSRETNGKGTLILCEQHELDVNSPKTKEEIEKELAGTLHINKFIWLKKGIPQDDSRLNGPLFANVHPNGVNGHVDEFCRFVNPNTILISSVSDSEAKSLPVLAEAKKRLDENYNILVNSTDQDGNKFNVIKIPFAPVIITDRSTDGNKKYVTSVTSYTNFIITNSFVIVPSYMSSAKESNRQMYQDKENRVEEIFRNVFPNKEIVKVQSTDLNLFSGGFHCISLHEPRPFKK